MKHLHLVSGLVLGVVLAGCGDYGDDGAVNRTGSDVADSASTDFNLAVAVPQFDALSGKLQRSDRGFSRAVTGSAPFTELVQDDVRAYVIVPDDSSPAGYREVAIDVVEFANLGNGRYRIAIDGQAQVDGFFAIEIGGVTFRVPMSRTGSTDEPIDVNVLQAALGDRLQALLIANEVCDAVTVDQLNTLFDGGAAYMQALDLPDTINDVESLIDFYRVAVSGFIQSGIDELCAPALDSAAITALAGEYHSLFSGAGASYSGVTGEQGVTLKVFSATTSQRPLSVDAVAGSASFGGSVESGAEHYVNFVYDTDNAVLAYGVSGALQATFDDTISLNAFANDPLRVQFNFAEQVEVYPEVELRTMLVEQAAPVLAYPHESSLFGARSVAAAVFDLGNADSVCLDALGLTSAIVNDGAAFTSETAAVIASLGAEEVANRLAQSCGEPAELRYERFIDVDSQQSSGLPLEDLTGSRFAFVTLESSLLASDDGTQGGVDGHALDAVFDIDSEATLSYVAEAQVKAQLPADAALPLSGAIINGSFLSQLQLLPAYDGQQQLLTNGQLNLQVNEANRAVRTYSGFADASRNLLAFDLSSQTTGAVPKALGGNYFLDVESAGLGNANVSDIAYAAGYAYYAAGTAGLVIYDVTDPFNIAHVSSVSSLGNVVGVAVSGSRVFVTAISGGMSVVDVTDPAAPSVAGNLGSPSIASAGAIAVDTGNTVFVADGATLRAVDVSTPSAPTLAGSLTLAASIVSLEVHGNTVYATVSDGSVAYQFVAINASAPASMSVAGTLSLTDAPRTTEVVGSTAYIGLTSSGVVVADISNVAAMTSVGSFGVSIGTVSDIAVDATTVYVSFDSDGSFLVQYDVTDPTNVQTLASLRVAGNTQFDVVAGDLIGIDGYGAPRAIALRFSPGLAALIGTQTLTASVSAIQSAGTTAYVADAGNLSVVDLTTPQTPSILGSTPLTGITTAAMKLSGNYLYLTDSTNQLLRLFDVSNASTPVEVGSAAASVYALGVDVAGNYAFVADYTAGVSIFDVSTPASPSLLQSVLLSNSASANAVAVSGNYVYVASDLGLAVVDATTPGNASEVASLTLGTMCTDIVLSGNTAFVACTGGLRVIDITSPAAPVAVGAYSTPGFFYALRLSGNYLYLSADTGVLVLDVSTPSTPRAVGAVNDENLSGDLELVSGYLVTGTTTPGNALQVFNVSPQTNYSVNTAGVALAARLPSAVPTPGDLVGRQFTLVGQQAGFSQTSSARKVVAGVLGAGKLRFAGNATNGVYPVVDLPLEAIVSVSFDGAMPELSLLFDQWTPSAVTVDVNGRLVFSLTSASESVTFSGYLSTDGLLIGRTELLTADPAVTPVVSELGSGSETTYPQVLRSLQGIVVGVPR